LDHFDMIASMIDDGFHQLPSYPSLSGIGSNVHAPQEALMPLLFAFMDAKSGDPQ